ncbi:hypothetical protein Fcan01_16973 [Folsomia candida]|uniref:Uncharacterized protein n=1 Tax=Folsomia candida TaxID=158441 RepID=A0A226DU15_FOLCA|nr:hypothetical protein Fcan01_16973 [Folsomia candida]
MTTRQITTHIVIFLLISRICHSEPNHHPIHLPESFDRCTFAILSDFHNDDRPFQSFVIPQVGPAPKFQAVLIDHVAENDKPSRLPGLVGLRIPSKFSTCNALVLYTFWISNSSPTLITDILVYRAAQSSNPQFVIIQYNSNILPDFHRIYVSSVFLIFLPTSNTFILPCLACKYGTAQAMTTFTNEMSIIDIKRQWFLTNKNLAQNFINTIFYRGHINNENQGLEQCSLRNNPKFSDSNADNCVEMQLSETYNFTVYKISRFERTLKTYGFIVRGHPSLSGFNLILRIFMAGLLWIIHGVKIEPYHFAVITDPDVMSLSAIFMPFDGVTWILLIVVLTLLSILLGLNPTKLKISVTDTLKVHLFWASSVFLEQSDPKPFRQTSYENIIPVLILLWLIVSFFCGVFYKGALYSYVTARQSPSVPLNLEEVVKGNLAIMTSTSITSGQGLICALEMIIPGLLVTYIESSSTDSFYFLLTSISNEIKCLRGDESELAKNFSLGGKVQVHPNSTIPLQPTFVMLNGATDLASFIRSMKYFSKSFVIKSQEETPFVFRVPWMVARNFFYDLFSNGLGALVESGIYQRWRELSDIGVQLVALSRTDGVKNVNHYARLMLSVDQHDTNLSEAQQVTMALMKMPFAFCGIFYVLSILVFFSEAVEVWRVKNLRVWRWGSRSKVISLRDSSSVGLFPWLS